MSAWDFDTKAIHSGIDPARHQGSTSIPVYETTSFAYDSARDLADVFEGKKFGYIYSRISNPTVAAFEQKINALENGVGAIAASSGMAAIATVLFSLTGQGDEIASSKSLFGGTLHLFNRILKKYGVRIRFFDPLDLEALKGAITGRTKLIFVETIGNPRLDIPDIGRMAKLAVENNIPLVVDSTLTTPYLFKAKDFGAAIVIHSSTKYITGNGNTIGGVIVDLGNYDWQDGRDGEIKAMAESIGSDFAFLSLARRHILENTGCCPSPFNVYLQFLGLETLSLRMERHCSNALTLAELLKDRSEIIEVNYPGLEDDPCFETARSQFGGKFGGLLTFKLGSRERCFALIDNLKLVKNLANLGDAKTLIIHPASTIYHDCSKEEMAQAGVSEDLLRVSVGIESITDIIADFEQAFKEAC